MFPDLFLPISFALLLVAASLGLVQIVFLPVSSLWSHLPLGLMPYEVACQCLPSYVVNATLGVAVQTAGCIGVLAPCDVAVDQV